jgi:hypothetical protein
MKNIIHWALSFSLIGLLLLIQSPCPLLSIQIFYFFLIKSWKGECVQGFVLFF